MATNRYTRPSPQAPTPTSRSATTSSRPRGNAVVHRRRGSGSSAGEFEVNRRGRYSRGPGSSASDPEAAAAATARRNFDYGAGGAIGDLLASIDADYRDAIARARGSGGGGGGGGGGGAGYADAIKEAEELLADVIGNRAALNSIYGDYDAVVDPHSDEAIAAAAALVAENEGAYGSIAEGEQGGIEGAYDQSDAVIAEMAALIGAGETEAAVQAEGSQMEEIELERALNDADTSSKVLGLTGAHAQATAQADRSFDEGEFDRRAELVDMEFEQMEEDVREQIKQLRQAAAAAASAARGRRRAAASEAAMLEEERFLALQINPHEAGEATSLAWLSNNGGDLDYNRQQLVLSTVSNAISQQVTPGLVPRWLQENGIRLSPTESRLVRGGINAYVAGMRRQQNQDRSLTAPSQRGRGPMDRPETKRSAARSGGTQFRSRGNAR